jgi:hypothetical protein
MIQKQKTGYVPDYMLAAAYNSLGHKKEALDHLKKSISSGGEAFFVWGAEEDPMFESLRDEPGFQEIVALIRKKFGANHLPPDHVH